MDRLINCQLTKNAQKNIEFFRINAFLSKYILDKLMISIFNVENPYIILNINFPAYVFLEPNYLIENIPILPDPQKSRIKNSFFYFRFRQKQQK